MIAFTLAELSAFTHVPLTGPVTAPAATAANTASTSDTATAGTLGSDVVIEHVSTSSREIVPSKTIFIPLKGERFDGHSFILDALRAGACAFASAQSEEQLCAAMTKEQQAEYWQLRQHVSVFFCSDTLRFLGLCGQMVRRKSKVVIGAITGSCGKTTVKEMSAHILEQAAPTLFTSGNFNNDVGVPLTLLRLTQDQPYAIIEQGASHLQDISRTAEFVESDYALITNVGDAHILGFGSHEGVYQGKSEILDNLYARYPVEQKQMVPSLRGERLAGIAVVPADSEWWPRWQKDYAAAVQAGKLLSFGESDAATLQVTDIAESAECISFHLRCRDPRWSLDDDFILQMLGRHNAVNAAGAALLALVMGANATEVKNGLQDAHLIKGRLTPQHFGHLTIIDDAYNASFNAVLAAIDTLNKQPGLRILVLGDMGELGSDEIALHEAVGKYAQNKVDLLLCIGPLSQYCVSAMGHQACHFVRHSDLIQVLQARVGETLATRQRVCCLIKGSHAMHMEQVVTSLQELGKMRIPQDLPAALKQAQGESKDAPAALTKGGADTANASVASTATSAAATSAAASGSASAVTGAGAVTAGAGAANSAAQ